MSGQVVLPRRSGRLATIIPASQWISIGYSNEEAQLMENLQAGIKKYCDGEVGSDETDVTLEGNPGIILPYHDMLLPHWKKLANALIRTSVETVTMRRVCLPISVLDTIFPAMNANNNLANLAELGRDEFLKLSSFLRENTSINHLILAGDTIDESVSTPLSDALNVHTSLNRLSFIECGLNNTAVLRIILGGCTRVNDIMITMNELGSESVGILADYISSNKKMGSIIHSERTCIPYHDNCGPR